MISRSLGPGVRMLVAALLAATASACAQNRPFVWVQSMPDVEVTRMIARGDTIGVVVQNQADLSGQFTVLENGAYVQPVVGQVSVAGLSEADASKRLAKALDGVVVDPKVQLSVVTPRPVRVSVTGEVQAPGNFNVVYDSTVLSVLAQAGGLTPFADGNGIYLIRTRPELIRVRFRYDDLKGGDPASTLFRLRDGDVIVVE